MYWGTRSRDNFKMFSWLFGPLRLRIDSDCILFSLFKVKIPSKAFWFLVKVLSKEPSQDSESFIDLLAAMAWVLIFYFWYLSRNPDLLSVLESKEAYVSSIALLDKSFKLFFDLFLIASSKYLVFFFFSFRNLWGDLLLILSIIWSNITFRSTKGSILPPRIYLKLSFIFSRDFCDSKLLSSNSL